jgi:hypothetical protein
LRRRNSPEAGPEIPVAIAMALSKQAMANAETRSRAIAAGTAAYNIPFYFTERDQGLGRPPGPLASKHGCLLSFYIAIEEVIGRGHRALQRRAEYTSRSHPMPVERKARDLLSSGAISTRHHRSHDALVMMTFTWLAACSPRPKKGMSLKRRRGNLEQTFTVNAAEAARNNREGYTSPSRSILEKSCLIKKQESISF